MSHPSAIQRYFCTECGRAYDQPGNCPTHTDEPLLDLADEEVRLMLEDQDGSAKLRHAAILVGVIAAVTFVAAVLVMLVVDMLDLGEYVNFARVMIVLAVGFYFAGFAMFKFKGKAPKLSPEQVAYLESLRGS